MHTHAVDDMQVALRHSCRRQCLPYAGARFAQYAEILDPAELWEQDRPAPQRSSHLRRLALYALTAVTTGYGLPRPPELPGVPGLTGSLGLLRAPPNP